MTEESKVMTTLEAALRRGGALHAFLSGGGLRVVRIEKPRHGKLVAYGEAPHLADALRIAAEDFKAGGRPYGEVYGKVETHYLTGISTPDGALDAFVLRGCTIDAHVDGQEVVAELHGWSDRVTTRDLTKRVFAGETVRWTSERGVVYESAPSRFPNGEACCSTRVVSSPEGKDAWMWQTVQRGRARTLGEAFEAALVAKVEEE